MQALRVRFLGAWLRYGRRRAWVLEDVNLELPAGTVAIVAGRNGAGKTTLLSAAAGLLPPDRGSIVDRPASVGWVPERFPANQPFTVRGYLTRMGRVRGLSPQSAARTVGEWAQRLYLEPFLDTRLAEISKGTAQKVGLAQALLVVPELLVLDEPWEGLDAATRQAIPAIVAEVISAGGSVLVSDHIGEVDVLPGARLWTASGGRVSEASSSAPRVIIEIGVEAVDVSATLVRLREAGHDVLGVRPS
jgi:ABC-type multidrug transport system ATPase subunit